MMVVIAIIVILMTLIAPAFTSLKSAGDVTSAAYTIKVSSTKRALTRRRIILTHGSASLRKNVASTTPGTVGVGRLVMSIVASNDGTIIYTPSSPGTIDPTRLLQVGKLTKIDDVHLWTHTDAPSGTGSTFDTRPNVTSTYCNWEYESGRYPISISSRKPSTCRTVLV